jgi:probable phosphoglycerate mutase
VPTLYLARHGETDWNRARRWQGATDVELNDDGRAQARALAERLRGLGITRVHTSNLRRAHETADIVANALPATFLGASPSFRERGFGVFEGRTREECEAGWPGAWRAYIEDFRNTPPDAEPAHRVVERMRAGLLAVAYAAEGGTALVVSHGASMRMLLGSVPGPRARGASRARPLSPIGNGAVYRLVLEVDTIASYEPVLVAVQVATRAPVEPTRG